MRMTNSAFSLIEIVVALAIFAFAITAIVGLMGSAMVQTRDSEENIQAANLSTTLIALYKQNLQLLYEGAPESAPSWRADFPLPKIIPQETSPGAFLPGTRQAIDSQGRKEDNADAVYTVNCIAWIEPELRIGEKKPSSSSLLVHCSLKLEWPAAASINGTAQGAYLTQTSFLLTK
jgi:prepilin-type N-terminal cleavage/methylation domain-containing protein